jgi:hypothetical protein
MAKLPNVLRSRKQCLRIVHCNIQGIRNKYIELKQLAIKHQPDILILNECKIDFTKCKYNIPGFNKIYDARAAHLVTAMYIKHGLRWNLTTVIPGVDDVNRCIEGVAIKLETSNGGIIVRGLYNPHLRFSQIRADWEALLEDNTTSINVGDLNLRMQQLGHSQTQAAGNLVKRAIDNREAKLVHTNLPSRPCHRGDGILDVALVTQEAMELTYRTKQLDSISSDHYPWQLEVDIETSEYVQLRRTMGNITESKESRIKFQELIETNLPLTEPTTDVEAELYVEQMEDILTGALDEMAPLREAKRREELPMHIQYMIQHRNRSKLRAKNAPRGHILRRIYNAAKNILKQALQEYRETQWNTVIESPENNFTKMWKIQRSLKAKPQRLPELPGMVTEEDTINALVDTAIVKDAIVSHDHANTEIFTPYQPLSETNLNEVIRALRLFKNKKAPGPDQLRADALKLAGPAYHNALAHIINYTLRTGYFPKRWKLGDCIFLHKPGKSHTEAASYRPITLLCIMGKLCERIMYSRILSEINRLELIPEYQHGFTKHKGTGTQILRTGKVITDALAKRNSVAMISTDLSKAFDSINHTGLSRKLFDAGMANNVIQLIENYLSGREARGKYRTMYGKKMPVPHGVPQGSILGPILFNLYVSDIPKNHIAGITLSQYADDLCILNEACNPDTASRRAAWAAKTIINYYKEWGLQCNVNKTDCAMFTNKRKYSRTVKLEHENLPIKTSIKYLGVHLDQRLVMKEHAKNTVKKVKQVRGMLAPIIGWYSKVSLEIKIKVIKATLLPIIDYGIVQLYPRVCKSKLTELERQYRMALKVAANFPRNTSSKVIWEMLDEDPWYLRARDLHEDMLRKLSDLQIPGLTQPGDKYDKPNHHNPMLPSLRAGDIDYVCKQQRGKPLSKRMVPPRIPVL